MFIDQQIKTVDKTSKFKKGISFLRYFKHRWEYIFIENSKPIKSKHHEKRH